MIKVIDNFLIKLAPAFTLMVFTATTLSAAEPGGYMRCIVTDQTILRTADGKVSTYGFFQGEFSKGDELSFTYEFSRVGLRMSLDDSKRNQNVVAMGPMNPENFKKSSSSDLLVGKDEYDAASFGQDYVRFENALGEFYLSRYYKSDWEGMLLRNFVEPLTGVVTTVSCRHQIDQIAAIQTLMR